VTKKYQVSLSGLICGGNVLGELMALIIGILSHITTPWLRFPESSPLHLLYRWIFCFLRFTQNII